MTCEPLFDLLDSIARKDEAALAALRDKTRARLTFFARGIVRDESLAEEVVQDVYTYVWMNASAYRRDRGNPLSWLHMLARSRALDSRRRGKKDSQMSALDDTLRTTPIASEVWGYAMLRRAVRELPGTQQKLIHMAFFEGYTHTEIAESMAMPLGTVKTRIRAALTTLRPRASKAQCYI